MDNIKGVITGTVITILIGGTAYTVSQSDVIKNFADDTGLTQEQAEQYINEIPEEELANWDEIGYALIEDGQALLSIANEMDCINYEYEWESVTLSCSEGKEQLNKLARDTTLLGQAYIKLSSDSASKDDIAETISLIDQLNSDYEFDVVKITVDWETIDEIRKTNSYNKALLKATLEIN
ncbi:MAG: hypothetical protein WDZ64_01195 [Parcubacteria group bacterium]